VQSNTDICAGELGHRHKPSVALVDVDPTTGRARLSYRRAAEVFEQLTAELPGGP